MHIYDAAPLAEKLTFADLKPGDFFEDAQGDVALRVEESRDNNAVVLRRSNNRANPPFLFQYDPGAEVQRLDISLVEGYRR